MKKLIAATVLFIALASAAYAENCYTDCWTDDWGNQHCATRCDNRLW